MIRKLLKKGVAFLLIFTLIFLCIQEVMRYKFNEKLGDLYKDYMEEKENSVDVVFIGSSSTYADIVPTVIWKESGITAYNLGVVTSASFISYYQLRFLLEVKKQKPKLIVFGFTRYGANARASSTAKLENSHRKAIDAMPLLKLKYEMIFQLKKDNPKQNLFTYLFPLLRYHSRWNDLTKEDFQPSEHDNYSKGGIFRNATSATPIDCHAELFDAGIEPIAADDYTYGHYKKIVELCKENDIPMAVACYPRENTERWISVFNALEGFCADNEIKFYNLSTPENWAALGIDGATDFFDEGHLNARGAVKTSQAFAKQLQEDFDLPDHRGDPEYSSWDDAWNTFYANNTDVLAEFGY